MVDPFLRKNTPNQTPTQQPGLQQPAPVAPQQPQKVGAPKGKTLSLKTILLGCLGFTIILVGLAALVLYMMIQNPDQYASIGLDRATIQVLLQTFALLFFGFLFFLGFGLLLVNGYKFITVKNKPRTGYLITTIVGFIVLLISIAVGAGVLTRIGNLEVSKGIDTGSLVMPYLVLESGPTSIVQNPDLALIAPASMVFQLNSAIFNRQVLPTLGAVDLQSVVMTCGDGNQLSLNFATAQFDGSCYYSSQGQYPIVLTINYIDRQTTETKVATYDVGALQFVSEISVSVQDGTIIQGGGELVAGKAPRKITFDASAVFRDLGLPDYRIVWDVDGDGQNDGENIADITRIYNQPQLYNVVVRFPGVNTFAYTFPLRIEQPNVPICIINTTQLQGTSYRIQANLTGRVARIDGYNFSVLDISNGRKVVGAQKSTTNAIDYTFPGQGAYAVKLDFVTSDGRQGSCESQNIAVGQADFTIEYDILYKSPAEPKFTKVTASTPVKFQGSSLTIQELPTIIQLQIKDVKPVSQSAELSVFFNNIAILSSDNKTFEMRVNSKEGNVIKIVVNDAVRNARTEEQILMDVQQAPVVGKLEIKPDTVGNDPFIVTFDASTTLLNDPSDEIVYFSRNFGDGTVKPNISQSVITHTYNYDYENENGIFKPSVDIVTKKGRSITIRPADDIIVKKAVQEVLIRIDSHPAQVARIGDAVEFGLDVSGLPKTIKRDFGNGNVIELPGRQGVNVSQTFTENKDYTIRVTVEYENQPSVEGKIVLKVQ